MNAFENCPDLDDFMQGLIKRNPHETEFHQAVREVAESVVPYVLEHRQYKDAQILERMTEPDRIVIFRVTDLPPRFSPHSTVDRGWFAEAGVAERSPALQ
ncbi:NADP-specific glutamate dehydrogenase [Mucisphaera calidilacus]|uniref:NADP-specific glutamate dehydrogenase n=1 Tax=Mucisphaera calidilacus TaxID=2527982 RepID=A0A518BVQ3_9BACT|nr:NADP-specific glutamate dehydrogenase [Mucisphaera calidilacus]